MTKWLGVAIGIIVLVVATAAGLLAWFDGERVRSLLADRLLSEYGVVLNIEQLERSYSVVPLVTLNGLTLTTEKHKDDSLIRIDRARFRVSLPRLVFGKVSLDELQVDGVQIAIPVDEDGVLYWEPIVDVISAWLHRFDWAVHRFAIRGLELDSRNQHRDNALLVSAQQVAGTMPELADLALLAQGVKMNLRTALPLQLKGTANLDKVELGRTGDDRPMTLTATGHIEDKALKIEASGGNLLGGDPLARDPVHGAVVLGDAVLRLQGTMSRDHDTHVDLNASVDVPGEDRQPDLHASFDVSDPGEGWRFESIDIQRGDERLAGHFAIDNRDGRRFVAADLLLENVDYPWQEDKETSDESSGPGPLPEGDLYAHLLDFIRTFDAELEVSGSGSALYGVPLKTFSARATTDDGAFSLAIDDTTVLEGALRASFRLEPGEQETGVDFELELKDAGLETFTAGRGALDGISGSFDGEVKLKANGREFDDVMATLAGHSTFHLSEGSIPDELATWMAGDIFSAVFADFDAEDTTKIDCAIADLQIDDGVAVSRAMVVDTGSFTIHGSGEIDFGKRRLNLELVPSSKEFNLISMRLPLRIRGPFDDVELDPDTSEAAISFLAPITSERDRSHACL